MTGPLTPSEAPDPRLFERAQAWAQRLGPGFAIEPLQRLLALDPQGKSGLLAQLLGVFEDSLRSQALALEQGIASVDFDRIRRAAHTVRSSSLSMGAEAFAAACLVLEKDAQALAVGVAVDEGAPRPDAQSVLQQARWVWQQAQVLRSQVLRAQSPQAV